MNIAIKTRNAKNAPCPAQWYMPLGIKTHGILLYIHGGSFTLEASPLVTSMMGQIAHDAQLDVLMPQYRLAPEHPCPAAIEDVQAVYLWALSQGHAPQNIIVSAEQAGGAIALASLQQLQRQGHQMPGGMVLFSPLVDLTMDNWSILLRGLSSQKHSRELLTIAIRMYLGVYGTPMTANNPLASPLFGSMQNLPPTLIQARDDTFILEDAKRLVQAYKDAGQNATLNIWPETERLWERYAPPNYGDMVKDSVEFIRMLKAN